jgi:hypothetical protein
VAVVGIVLGMLAFGATPATAAARPSVTKVSPGSGSTAGGTRVTVTGHNFAHVHSVTFGSANGKSLHVVSSTKLMVTAPKHSAGTVSVRVHASAGMSATAHAAQFTYTTKGAIAGTVTARSGGRKLSGVRVLAYSPAAELVVREVNTGSDGSYRLGGLRGSHSYDVCFFAQGLTDGSATGYANECYRHTAWDGYAVPAAAAEEVHVAAGRTVTGINAALTNGGAISGSVIAADDSTPLRHVRVSVIDVSSGNRISSSVTGHNGHYTLIGLGKRAAGYVVCFDGSPGKGGPSAAGYLSQCYDSTAWDGNTFDVPTDATPVPVSAGVVAPDINAALDSAATLSGTVTAASDATPLSSVLVLVVRDGETDLAVDPVSTDADGHFLIAGLATGTYDLCFADTSDVGGPSFGGYLNECYDDQFWDGDTNDIPGTAAAVSVTAGEPTTGKDADLAAGSGIAGRVTEAGGTPLTFVIVDLYGGDNLLASTTTDSKGDYAFRGRLPVSGYHLCFDGSIAGKFDECYDDVEWDGVNPPPAEAVTFDLPAGELLFGINAELS